MSTHITNGEERRLHLLERIAIMEAEQAIMEAERAIVDAELANMPSSSAPPAPRAHHGRHQAPRQSVPRSYSHSGQSMSRTISSV
jgi:hypothetical protein